MLLLNILIHLPSFTTTSLLRGEYECPHSKVMNLSKLKIKRQCGRNYVYSKWLDFLYVFIEIRVLCKYNKTGFYQNNWYKFEKLPLFYALFLPQQPFNKH